MHSENFEAQKTHYEGLLWAKAGELAVVRKALATRKEELERIFTERPNEKLNLHELDARRGEEDEYFRINAKIQEIERQEKEIEDMLSDFDQGKLDALRIESLARGPDISDERKLSKKRQRILEEKQRLGMDPREIMADMYREFGSEKMHLTTGRNLSRVRNLGQMTPEQAASEFFYRTTDTHGGKTEHGKKGDTYISPGGKRIRKR